MTSIIKYLSLLFAVAVLTSCGAYQNTVLFKTDGNIDNAKFKVAIGEAERNYLVQKFDYLGVDVYTKKGEIIVDKEGALLGSNPQTRILMQQQATGAGMGGAAGTNPNAFVFPRYLVNDDGTAYLPMVGIVKVEGLRIYQVDSLLSVKYGEFYEGAYVNTRLLNRRVVVMGALGNKIINLENESTNLLEVLTLAGNMDLNSRSDRIRLIRGVLHEPAIQVINLTTWEGMKAANLRVEPNDVIYVEPRRRLGRREALSDIASIVGIFGGLLGSVSSVVTAIVLIRTL